MDLRAGAPSRRPEGAPQRVRLRGCLPCDSCQGRAARPPGLCVWTPWPQLPPGSSGGQSFTRCVSSAGGSPRPLRRLGVCVGGGGRRPPPSPGPGPRAPASCRRCGPGGLWVTRRTSGPGHPRPRGTRRALCPSRAWAFCWLLDLSFQGGEGICARQSPRKKEKGKKRVKILCNPLNTPPLPAPHPRKCLLNNGRSWEGCHSCSCSGVCRLGGISWGLCDNDWSIAVQRMCEGTAGSNQMRKPKLCSLF